MGIKKKKQEMQKYGYYRDNQLSNDNEQVYYNPTKKKLLVNVAGTHNLSDVGTDIWLAAGYLKNTNRYKEGEKVLKSAKQKYGLDKAIITGHSLGSGVVNGIASSNDKVYNVDSAYTIGQKARKNVKNFNTSGDIVSLFSPSSNSKTLQNPNWKTGNYFLDTYC